MFPKYYLFFYFFLCSGDCFNFCTLLQRWADSILHKIVPKISFISEFSRLIRSTLTIFFVLLWNLKSFRKHFRENSSLYSCCLKNVTCRTTYSGGGGEGKVVLSWVLFRKTNDPTFTEYGISYFSMCTKNNDFGRVWHRFCEGSDSGKPYHPGTLYTVFLLYRSKLW